MKGSVSEMSLTSKLKSKKPEDIAFQKLLRANLPKSQDFHTLSGKKSFSKEYELLIEYKLLNPYEASLLGTAFDYLIRLDIARKTGQPFDVDKIVAVKGYSRLKNLFPKDKSLPKKFSTAQKNMKNYQSDKSLGLLKNKEAIYADCFLCANLDIVVRSGQPPETLTKMYTLPNKVFLEEFKELQYLAHEKLLNLFSESDSIYYNPKFGIASAMVGGADGDIILNDTLIDFKTSKNSGYSWQEAAQLVGYYLLSKIDQKLGNPRAVDFNKVALYQARYGELVTIVLDKFYGDRLDELVNEVFVVLRKDKTYIRRFPPELYMNLMDIQELR